MTARQLFDRKSAVLEYRPVWNGVDYDWYWVLLPVPDESRAIYSGVETSKAEASIAARLQARRGGYQVTQVRSAHKELTESTVDDPREFLNRTFTPEQIHHQLVALAVEAAELVLPIFERVFERARRKDTRPRKAIEAAKAWLKNPSTEIYDSIQRDAITAAQYVLRVPNGTHTAYAAAVAAAYSVNVLLFPDRSVWHAQSAINNADDAADAAPELKGRIGTIKSRIKWLGSILVKL